MKKRLAWILVICMVLQLSSVTAYAEENHKMQDAKVKETSVNAIEDKGSEVAEKAETGNLSIDITCALPISNVWERLNQIQAVLMKEDEQIASASFSTGGKEDKKAAAKMTDLALGTYQLKVSGAGFTYNQNVEIQNQNQQIQLVDMTTVTNTQSGHPGTFGYGDLNGDGSINEEDRILLLDALSNGEYVSAYDLNGDGSVELADLQCFTYSYGVTSNEASVVRTAIIDEQKVEAQVAEGTKLAEGNAISDILTGKGGISVQPASEEDISDENPVEISIDFTEQNVQAVGGISIAPPKASDNIIEAALFSIDYIDENGLEGTKEVQYGGVAKFSRTREAATVTREPDGTLVIDLGSQVAIKKITIKVTDTQSKRLADIAKVEFLNDMESRIPAPVMNIPEKLSVIPSDKKFTLTWNAQQNVSGYEVEITYNGVTVKVPTSTNQLTVSSFQDEKLKNKEIYKVRVQSVNGEWSSGYSDYVDAVPIPTKAPDPPENVNITGGYCLLDISWKKMKDTDYYTLYYRVKGESQYQKIENITNPSYRLTKLKAKTQYEICLTGTNDIGTSQMSTLYSGTTMDLDPPITSNYKRINTSNGVGNVTAHIAKVEYPSAKPEKEMAIVDDDYTSSWTLPSWDGGGANAGKPSPIVEFDQAYEMNRITVVPDAGQVGQYAYAKTRYWDESGKVTMIDGFLTTKTSSNGKIYYELWFDKPFTAKKIQVNLAQYFAGNNSLSISEMKFYYYDSVDADIEALYTDALHITLAEGVTKEKIDALEARVNTKDEVSSEYHPRRDILLRELENARNILAEKNLSEALQIDTNIIKSKDNALKISAGLNSWQPLGIVAHEGEELAIYVGQKGAAIGANTQVRLIATQYHAESSKWNSVVVSNLKQGRNIVSMPAISSLDVEHGGSLYVEFTGSKSDYNIQVRVSGGSKIPMLYYSKASNEAEKREAVKTYVEQLNAYVPGIEEQHNTLHLNQDETHCNYEFKENNCILGATEIVLDQIMYSVSAKQILAGVNSRAGANGQTVTVESQTEALYQSLEAMDQMVTLFYQHKGLTNQVVPQAYGTANSFPVSRLNIRYMRMFAGAFMYAGGLHVGIEWGSVPGLATGQPVVSKNGKYESGQLFGWGIAHEIGHIINQPDYATAEITNNYYSILAQADETNEKVRFVYSDVFEKVTSGTKGKDSDVFTSLAMYWQLHLAYDNGYNYKTYDNYEEQFQNLFFARVDAYARNTSLAPNGLTLAGADKDNVLIRLSCAAANKNLLSFFEKWGLTPDETTKAYAANFEEETRNICYITDEARAYRVEGGANAASNSQILASMNHEANSKQVTLSLKNTAKDQSAMLGYEIYRNGQVVGFVEAADGTTEFTDTIATANNQVFTYEVVGYDKALNTTQKVVLDPVKISHDGSISKALWSVTTNMSSSADKAEEGSDENPEPGIVSAIGKVYNDDYKDSYVSTGCKNPELMINFNETLAVAGMKITAPAESANAIKQYEVYVSKDQNEWTLAKSGSLSYDDGTATVYFSKADDSWMYTYDASYLKLVIKGQDKVELSEIDILGPAGDNVELVKDGIGILSEDYVYDKNAADGSIPKGSLIFTGEYKGNPAYNVVKLYNEKNEIIEGSQIIFAEVPEKGELGEISSGTWIYYIEPAEFEKLVREGNVPLSVRAELYRVDDAHTNEGERLVSDTLSVMLPDTLPDITVKGNNE